MFMAHATEFASNPAFLLKMLFLVAAGLNALFFHREPFRSVASGTPSVPPRAAGGGDRLDRVVVGVISAGRLLAYL